MPKELSKSYSKYGAEIGRYKYIKEPNVSVKMHLIKMKMSSCGAYDQGGAYWGCGDSQIGYMYHAWSNGEELETFVRATNRNNARIKVIEKFPNAKFYR